MFILVFFVALCLGVGALGGFWTSSSVTTWYVTLRKPSWNPPSWVFAPVWTFLYITMGIAAWIVWKHGSFVGLQAAVFLIQLALNLGWSWLFFFKRSPYWAFIEVMALWVAIAVTNLYFWHVDPLAGLLIVPYLAWVTFASTLNGVVWALNRS